jgi:hypothetical protein
MTLYHTLKHVRRNIPITNKGALSGGYLKLVVVRKVFCKDAYPARAVTWTAAGQSLFRLRIPICSPFPMTFPELLPHVDFQPPTSSMREWRHPQLDAERQRRPTSILRKLHDGMPILNWMLYLRRDGHTLAVYLSTT